MTHNYIQWNSAKYVETKISTTVIQNFDTRQIKTYLSTRFGG